MSSGNQWRALPAETCATMRAFGQQAVAGTRIRTIETTSVLGEPIRVPEPTGLTHLQFRRFAGCPVCSLHLRGIARRHDELVAARVQEVGVLLSSDASLRPHVADPPFEVIADPDRELYAEFGLETSTRAVLDPRAWGAMTRGTAIDLVRVARGRQPLPRSDRDGGGLGLPADLLLAPDGEVLAVKYGTHADDQWSFDEILTLARNHADRATG